MGADQSTPGQEPAQVAPKNRQDTPALPPKTIPETPAIPPKTIPEAPMPKKSSKTFLSRIFPTTEKPAPGQNGGSRKKKLKRVKRNKTNKYKKYKK